VYQSRLWKEEGKITEEKVVVMEECNARVKGGIGAVEFGEQG
jgi:hypothetical protein